MLLTMKSILINAQTYLDNKKLGAVAGKLDCQYDYGDGCRCVIGASFNEDQIQRLKEISCPNPPAGESVPFEYPRNANELPFLYNKNITLRIKQALPEVEIDLKEAKDISVLQRKHDTACKIIEEFPTDPEVRKEKLNDFLETFEFMKVKYNVSA